MNFWKNIEQRQIFLKHPAYLEFLKFSVVGLTGTTVDFGIYAILTRVLGVYYILATAISVFIAIINNFLLNKYWTFKKGQSGRGGSEYVKFFVVSIINYFINIGITYVMVEYSHAELIFGTYNDFFAKVVAIGIVLFSNYFGNKLWTFKE
jgi:putative flippase GtrA